MGMVFAIVLLMLLHALDINGVVVVADVGHVCISRLKLSRL